MGLLDFIMYLLIAGVCGFAASTLMGARRMNVVMLVLLGFVGALVGTFIAKYFEFPLFWQLQIGDRSFAVVWAFLGSLLVVGIVSFIRHH
ncbi:GlsB/YeaQ/YmgE family stress response membrane protein [bacterium]|nr:GlsB/YeaQ/YmgE family stress response membrane protein [bacterium]